MGNLERRIDKLEQENAIENGNFPGSRIVIFHTFPDGQVFAPGQKRFYPDENAFWRGCGKDIDDSIPFPLRENVSPEEFLAKRAASEAAISKEFENWQPGEYALSRMQGGMPGPVAMLLEKLTNHNL